MTGTLKGFSVPVTWTLRRVSEDQAWAIPKPPVPKRPMPADADPVFEVATVKLTNPDQVARGRVDGGDISVANQTLRDLLMFALTFTPTRSSKRRRGQPRKGTTSRARPWESRTRIS